jgi:hypothetical protein
MLVRREFLLFCYKMPILAHNVTLEGVPHDSMLILQADFDEVFAKAKNMAFVIESLKVK